LHPRNSSANYENVSALFGLLSLRHKIDPQPTSLRRLSISLLEVQGVQ
jgi:hypothetical protein